MGAPWGGGPRDKADVALLVEPEGVPAIREALGVANVACRVTSESASR